MTNIPDSTQPEDHRPTRRSSNLRWIVSVAGGAITGMFVAIASMFAIGGIYDRPSCNETIGIGVVVGLTVGATIGGLLPWVGCLAGFGFIVGMLVYGVSGIDIAILACPLMGGGLGLVWSVRAWGRRDKQRSKAPPLDYEAVVAVRRDRIRLAWACLITGVIAGFLVAVWAGRDLTFVGTILGAVVGGMLFIGLMISAFLLGRKE